MPRPTTAATTIEIAVVTTRNDALVEAAFRISGIKTNSWLGRRSWQGRRIDDVHDSL